MDIDNDYQDQDPLLDASDTSPSSEQSPGSKSQHETSSPKAQLAESKSEKKQLVLNRIKKRGIVALIFGIIVLVGLFLPFVFINEKNDSPAVGAMFYLLYVPIYSYVRLGGIIVCIVFLILTLVDMKKNQLNFSKYVAMIIIGLLLTFSPYIYSEIQTAIIASDPFKIAAGGGSMSDCQTSAERGNNDAWSESDDDSIGKDPKYIAEDIACSYLEYFYDNGKEPYSSTQLSRYYQSYDAKNGIAAITINDSQPEKANVYNIITHRSCAYDDTKNDSAISVWYRVEKERNGIGCIEIEAIDYSDEKNHYYNLYDIEQSREWFEEQFKTAIDEDELQENNE